MVRQTSLIAYHEFCTDIFLQNERYKAIIKVLQQHPEGLTDMEITRELGYADPNKVRPRRNELVKYELVAEKEKRKCWVTGKMAIVWRVI